MQSDKSTTVPNESLQELDKPPKGKVKYSSSRIRDHLANERTYLAWMRTSVGLMGFGVVILRLRAFHPPLLPRPGYGWKLGLTFSIVGLLTVFLSTQHYFAVRWSIDEDSFEPPDRWVILFSLAVILLGTGILYFVFASSVSPAEMMVFEDSTI
jgi:putative membrane protein